MVAIARMKVLFAIALAYGKVMVRVIALKVVVWTTQVHRADLNPVWPTQVNQGDLNPVWP